MESKEQGKKSKEVIKRDTHPLADIVLMNVGLAVAGWSLLRYGFGNLEEPGAGFQPFFAGSIMAFFAAVSLIGSLKRGWMPLRSLWEGAKWQRGGLLMAALFFFAILMPYLGFALVSLLTMAFLYRMVEKPTWGATLLFASVTTASFYILFEVWLESQLPVGFLGF